MLVSTTAVGPDPLRFHDLPSWKLVVYGSTLLATSSALFGRVFANELLSRNPDLAFGCSSSWTLIYCILCVVTLSFFWLFVQYNARDFSCDAARSMGGKFTADSPALLGGLFNYLANTRDANLTIRQAGPGSNGVAVTYPCENGQNSEMIMFHSGGALAAALNLYNVPVALSVPSEICGKIDLSDARTIYSVVLDNVAFDGDGSLTLGSAVGNFRIIGGLTKSGAMEVVVDASRCLRLHSIDYYGNTDCRIKNNPPRRGYFSLPPCFSSLVVHRKNLREEEVDLAYDAWGVTRKKRGAEKCNRASFHGWRGAFGDYEKTSQNSDQGQGIGGDTVSDELRSAFAVLELPETASENEVKRVFRKLAMTYHPDKNNTPGATEMFQKVNSAYECICSAKGWCGKRRN